MTPAQSRALVELWPRFGVEAGPGMIDLPQLFGRDAPCFLEIGFGMGDALAQMAQARPEHNFLGIEVHRPGLGNLLRKLDDLHLDNVRVLAHDAVEVLRDSVADASLAGVYVFFPDPWPKKRHHKRRLIQPEFAALLCRKLARGGRLHLATDWEHYAQQMLAVLDATAGLRNSAGQGRYSNSRDDRPLTKFERRGLRLGHGVWDLIYTRER
jgi:tRNA (guanine-N7-)-methyltransferase